MNIYGAKELAASFRLVRKNTMRIANDIDEKDYAFRATPESKSIAGLLSHIALGTRFPAFIHGTEHLSTLEGFDFMSYMGKIAAEEATLTGKAAILAALEKEGEQFATWLDTVSNDLLAEVVSFPTGMMPPTKTRFEMLLAPKEHEMHHRGQLMVSQRLLGQVPPLTRDREAFMAAMREQG